MPCVHVETYAVLMQRGLVLTFSTAMARMYDTPDPSDPCSTALFGATMNGLDQ